MKYFINVLFMIMVLFLSCNEREKRNIMSNNRFRDSSCFLSSLSEYILLDSNSNSVKFTDLITKNTLLFTYSESICRPCLVDYFTLLKQFEKIVGREKIILIANYAKARGALIDAHMSGFPVYNLIMENKKCKEIKPFLESQPRVIVIDSNLNILNNRVGFAGDSLENPKFNEIEPLLR